MEESDQRKESKEAGIEIMAGFMQVKMTFQVHFWQVVPTFGSSTISYVKKHHLNFFGGCFKTKRVLTQFKQHGLQHELVVF